MTMQVAVHLDDTEHEAFGRWLARTAAAVGPGDPHLEPGEAIAAMIRCCLRYQDITDTVASQLRHERAAAQERGSCCLI
jgi:hypothetical protein